VRRVLRAIVCVVLLGSAVSAQPQERKPPGQEEFVPLSEIPPEEQIPAFTLVASAYAFVWIALAGYIWSLTRRLEKVETDLAAASRGRR
jgi:CcmD family protein